MSILGVVRNDSERTTHIIPCDDQGNVLPSHEATCNCKCKFAIGPDGAVIHEHEKQ